MRAWWWIPALLSLAACSSDDDSVSECTLPVTPTTVNCATGACPAIAVSGDAPATNPGTFKGFADPAVAADPDVPGRVWLGYSWPHAVAGEDPDGNPVQMAAVQNRLARSDDGGATFAFQQVLWPDVALADPEGSGENGRISSETASLAAITVGGTTTWYGAHLRYFLRPMTGYHPKYATSWHVRIGAASSPTGLSAAAPQETVLGVSATHSAYHPNVRLDQLAGLPIQHCAMANNPTLYADGPTLYLVVECLAFVGQTPDYANTSTQVFATNPVGAPTTWFWRHVGELGDHALATELGNDTILQPDVSRGANGKPLWVVTPAHIDTSTVVGTVGDGCVALELDSIDPPRLARDCNGDLVMHARVTGSGVGACTHDRDAATGLIATSTGPNGGLWTLRASGQHP